MSDPTDDPPVAPLDALVLRTTPASVTPYEIEDLKSCRRWAFATRRALWVFLRRALTPASTASHAGDRP
jgi:hypothetical protein